MGRVGEVDNGTSFEGFIQARSGGDEHVGEYSRLCGEKSAVNVESGFVSDEDDVAVIEPDLGMAL